MDQPIGHTTRLRLYLIRPLWSLGSGWAALGGGLAAGGFPLLPIAWLNLLLVWFLADPLLGVVWDIGVGDALSTRQRGIWRRLLSPHLPSVAPPVRPLPYTQVNSPGYRLANHLGRLRRWWKGTFWPDAGREFATLVAGLSLALLIGLVLRRDVLALVLASVLFSWLVTLSERSDATGDSGRVIQPQTSIATLWRALGEFGTPWLIGAVVMGGPSRVIILLGVCYTITYFGLIRDGGGFGLSVAGQAAAALLLAGLRHPLAAGAAVVLLMPQWGLYTWAAHATRLPRGHPDVYGRYLRYAQPFVVLSVLLATLALGS